MDIETLRVISVPYPEAKNTAGEAEYLVQNILKFVVSKP